nr:hypothetical protein [uncultured bacterium]
MPVSGLSRAANSQAPVLPCGASHTSSYLEMRLSSVSFEMFSPDLA